MKTLVLILLALLTLMCWSNLAMSQALNDVTIGKCAQREDIEGWIAAEQTRGLVMDARPFAINQSKGKLLFTGSGGRVSVVHMNPFVYSYKFKLRFAVRGCRTCRKKTHW